MSDNHYDVIIIGTGAGGGTLAYRLAPSGKRILLLERGGYVPREKQNWDSCAVEVENRYRIKEPWYALRRATWSKRGETDPEIAPILERGMRYVAEFASPEGGGGEE